MLRRILIVISVLIIFIIGAAIAIPFLFKDKILAAVKTSANTNISAKVDFTDVSLSLFKHFPKVSITLIQPDVSGINEFEGVKLFHADEIDIAVNAWSVVGGGGEYQVQSVYAKKPFINIVALNDGNANYHITKPDSTTTASSSNFKLALQSYSIEDGEIIVDYRPNAFSMDLKGINHSGSGDMTADVYDLNTKTVVDSLTVSYGGTTYIKNAHTDIKTLLDVNMKDMKFTLKNTDAKLNDLALKADGWLQMLKPAGYLMDAKFSAPSDNFKDFLSVVPDAYTKNFKDVKADGKFAFNGFVKGTYNGLEKIFPAYALNTTVNNGSFQYPSLPMGVRDLSAQVNISCPTGAPNDAIIDAPQFHLQLGNNPLDAVMHLKTPVSDPDIDLFAKGVLNMSDVPKAFPMESVKNLSGILSMDVTMKTLMSSIEKKIYDKVNIKGDIKLTDFNAQPKDYPTVKIRDLAMNFTPNFVGVKDFDAQMGKSDIKASGTIDNILAYFSTDRTMTGKLTMISHLIDANEWLKDTKTSSESTQSKQGKTVTDTKKPFDRFNFTLNAVCDQILYKNYDVLNSAFNGNATPNTLNVNLFKTQIGNTDISGKGNIANAYDWMFNNKTLTGNLELNSGMMDLNQFMTNTPQPKSSNTTNVPTEPIQVPKNLDVVITSKMNRVLYSNYDLRNVTGKLVVQNQEVKIEDAQANTMGGVVDIKGGYNTQNTQKPVFKLVCDLKNIDFQEAFKYVTTIQRFAPLTQYISGKFNTIINTDGELGKDLVPNFSTLNLSGFFQTLQGIIVGMKPLEDIATKLNLNELKKLDLSNTKNWIEIKNGSLLVHEFEKNLQDINLKIGGSHSLTNEMNYTIKARVPRKRLEGTGGIGAAAGNAYNDVVKEANKLGLNIKNSAFVNVAFNITGTFLKPNIGFKILGGDGDASLQDVAKQTAEAAFQKAKDSVTNVANAKLNEAKTKVTQAADKAIDSASKVLNAKVELAKNKAIEDAKKQAGDALGNEAGKKANEVLDKAGTDKKTKEELDKLKEKLNKWDPFGKNKPKKDSVG